VLDELLSRHHDVEDGIVNRRLRLLVGWLWAAVGVLVLISVPAAPTAAPRTVLGVVIVATGILWSRAFRLRVARPYLELRYPFRTRRFALADVDHCEPTTGSPGLIGTRTYPVFVMTDGRRVEFNVIQWAQKGSQQAETRCRSLTEQIRAAAADG
jgi:hypothetical protein